MALSPDNAAHYAPYVVLKGIDAFEHATRDPHYDSDVWLGRSSPPHRAAEDVRRDDPAPNVKPTADSPPHRAAEDVRRDDPPPPSPPSPPPSPVPLRHAISPPKRKIRNWVGRKTQTPRKEDTVVSNTPSSTIASEPSTLIALTTQGAKQGAAFAALRTALAAGARARGVDLDTNALNLLTATAAMTIHAAGAHGERPKLIAFGELALVGAASHGVVDLLGMLEEWVTPMLGAVMGE